MRVGTDRRSGLRSGYVSPMDSVSTIVEMHGMAAAHTSSSHWSWNQGKGQADKVRGEKKALEWYINNLQNRVAALEGKTGVQEDRLSIYIRRAQ